MKSLQRSFAGGEISPELFGRLDLTKFQTGLAECLNFRVLPHGPVENRAGLEYVIRTKDSTKRAVLIPFIYNSNQSVVLEFGDQYIRFHTLGGTVLETGQNITAITKANPGVLTYAGADPTNGQWFYLSGIAGMTQLNGRYVQVANVDTVANTYELKDPLTGANLNTSAFSTYTSGGTMARVYEITSPYVEADLYDLHFTQSADVLTIVHPTYQQRQLTRTAAANWTLATFTAVPTIGTPAAPAVAAPVAAGAATTYYYVCTAIAEGTLEESLASAEASVSNTLTTAGNYNTIDPPAVSGAIRYNIYKKVSGVYGYIGQTDGSALTDNNITPDLTQTPPQANDPFSGGGEYPGAVGYYKGRRWFAGSTNKPQNLWGTKSATESNMTYSIPTRDDDSITVKLRAREANTIRHIVPLGDLLLLTSGAEWLMRSQNSDTITPSTIDYNTQGYVGSSNTQPSVTSKSVLYEADKGGHVREMLYSFDSQGYDTKDISIMAPHLFDGYTIKQMAFSKAPVPTLWCVRSDGLLLGLTYLPEHEVYAWHKHETEGEFESVCAVPEGTEYVLYVTVLRTIGSSDVRCVERLATRRISRLDDAFFVDCGSRLNNTVAATLTPGTGADVQGTTDVVFTAGSAVFASTDVGRYIHYDYVSRERVNGKYRNLYKTAIAEITEYTNTTHVKATIDEAWPDTTAIASAGWRMTTDTITGLHHLEGETVKVLGDGAVFPDATVSGGSITLERGVSKASVGLAYESDLETLPMGTEGGAMGQGTQKNVNKVHLRVYQTSGIFVGPAFDKLKEVKQRTDEVWGAPPSPTTGMVRVSLTPTWSNDAPICVRQSDPLPITIVALVPDTTYGG